jgi:hypothetical protein
MEEPPKIEQIISSQGISLADTATLLNAYLSNIERDQYGLTTSAVAKTTTEGEVSETIHNKSRQEREEEALIAQMDQLANTKTSSSTGRMIPDDIYERLKLIAQSISAEVEGKSANSSRTISDTALQNDIGGGEDSNDTTTAGGAETFLAELDEAYRLEQEEQLHVARSSQTKKDKKKEKKAKKAAKKAKKEAKRKSLQSS